MLAWNSSRVTCSNSSTKNYSITAKVVLPCGSYTWLSVVYGPLEDTDKPTFLQEIRDIQSSISGPLDDSQ